MWKWLAPWVVEIWRTPIYSAILVIIGFELVLVLLQIGWILVQWLRWRRSDLVLKRCTDALAQPLLDAAHDSTARDLFLEKASAYPREILSLMIVPYITVTTGAYRDKLREIYEALGLLDRDLGLLHSSLWHRRLVAIRRVAVAARTVEKSRLIPLLHDRFMVRVIAAGLVAQSGSMHDLVLLLQSLHPSRRVMEQPVMNLISELPPKQIANVVGVLGEISSPVIRRMLVVRYVQVMPEEALPQLDAWASDESVEVRIGVCSACVTYSADDVRGVITKLLGDQEWQVRAQAAKTVGVVKDLVMIEHLTRVLCDRSFWVRQNAAASLTAFGKPGLDCLKAVIESGSDRFAIDAATQELRRYELVLQDGQVPR